MRKIASSILFWLVVCSPFAAAQVLPVSDVDSLYTAVNDAGNAGATLVLAPGIYVLSPADSHGVSRPNGGRIDLQRDMSLAGLEGDRGAVVIDAFHLPASSLPSGRNAVIRMGLGHNAIEWLTVRDGRFAQANIDTSLQPLDPDTAFVRIAHVASSGSVRGINVQNSGPQASGQTLEVDIIDSYFFDNRVGISQGIRIGNFLGANGSTVNVRMAGNQSWGQKAGCLIANNGATGSTVNVVSDGNQFYANGAGTIILGGLSTVANRADGNTVHFQARGDRFLRNTADTEFDRGGLVALGTDNATGVGGGSSNTVLVELWGCRMLDNNDADFKGIGARSGADSFAMSSQNNHVTIEIHGDADSHGKWKPVEVFADQVPALPDYGNTVTVRR
jgi:hypothetical protein